MDDFFSLFRNDGLIFFPETRVVWGKIPKVAGTSLLATLPAQLGRPVGIKNAPTDYRNLLRSFQRPEWFAFVFVRNPYDRFASLFRYWNDRIIVRSIGRPETFAEFVRKAPGRIDRDRRFAVHARRASDWLRLRPDFLGRFERLEDDAGDLLRTLGREPISIPKLNTTKKTEPISELYALSPIGLDFVEDYYSTDFDNLYRIGEINGET